MTRQILVTIAALLLSAPPVAHAQRQGGSHRPPPPPPPPTSPRTVAPPITYPFPPLMTPPAGGLTPRFGEGPPFRTRRPSPYNSGGYAPFFYGYPETGYGYPATTDVESRRSARAPSTGLLRLAVTPASAQVFVDSYYVGTVDDVNAQRVLELEAGPHRLEIRAPQYQSLTVDVRILPLETVTYRGALEPTRAPAPPQAAGGSVPTVMYVIPKCYLGNLPPRQDRLPSGCDAKQVQVIKPTVASR